MNNKDYYATSWADVLFKIEKHKDKELYMKAFMYTVSVYAEALGNIHNQQFFSKDNLNTIEYGKEYLNEIVKKNLKNKCNYIVSIFNIKLKHLQKNEP